MYTIHALQYSPVRPIHMNVISNISHGKWNSFFRWFYPIMVGLRLQSIWRQMLDLGALLLKEIHFTTWQCFCRLKIRWFLPVDVSAIVWRLKMFKHEVIGNKFPWDHIVRNLKHGYNVYSITVCSKLTQNGNIHYWLLSSDIVKFAIYIVY